MVYYPSMISRERDDTEKPLKRNAMLARSKILLVSFSANSRVSPRFRRSSNHPEEYTSQYLNQRIVTEERINTYTEKHVAISRHVRLLRLFCPPRGTCTRLMLLWQGGYVCAVEFNLVSVQASFRISFVTKYIFISMKSV